MTRFLGHCTVSVQILCYEMMNSSIYDTIEDASTLGENPKIKRIHWDSLTPIPSQFLLFFMKVGLAELLRWPTLFNEAYEGRVLG